MLHQPRHDSSLAEMKDKSLGIWLVVHRLSFTWQVGGTSRSDLQNVDNFVQIDVFSERDRETDTRTHGLTATPLWRLGARIFLKLIVGFLSGYGQLKSPNRVWIEGTPFESKLSIPGRCLQKEVFKTRLVSLQRL